MCRLALDLHRATSPSSTTLLDCMKEVVRSHKPLSLQNTADNQMTDMRVLSAADLTNETGNNGIDVTGSKAWSTLLSEVVVPLCHGKELNLLMDTSGRQKRKLFVGGALVYGESGAGKSTLAYEIAREASRRLPSLRLIDVACTSLVHKEVGGSEQALHRLFETVRRSTPCILLLEGIENIAAVRGNDSTTEGTLDRLLSTLLVELDGIGGSLVYGDRDGFAVIGTTMQMEWIDPALLRPGRLQRRIHLQAPDESERLFIIQQQEMHALGMSESELVATTAGKSYAAVRSYCQERKFQHAKSLLM